MIKTVGYKTNSQLQQNVIQTAFSNWQRHGDMLFPPQRQIYEGIAKNVKNRNIFEWGCGIGVGSIILKEEATKFVASDISERHIAYARKLYPEIKFCISDLSVEFNTFSIESAFLCLKDVAIAVELIEHIEDDEAALRNLLSSSEVWLSTPNRLAPGMGMNKPNNSFHVREYIPLELIEKIQPFLRDRVVTLYNPISFKQLEIDTVVSPVVYHIK